MVNRQRKTHRNFDMTQEWWCCTIPLSYLLYLQAHHKSQCLKSVKQHLDKPESCVGTNEVKIELLGLNPRSCVCCVLRKDNDLKQTSKDIMNYFKKHQLKLLERPSQSSENL